jgi:hypothetical protein
MGRDREYSTPNNDFTSSGYRPGAQYYASGESHLGLDEADFLTFKDEESRIQIRYPKDWSYSSDPFLRYMIVSFVPPPSLPTFKSIISNEIGMNNELSVERNLSKYLGKASVAVYVFPSFEKSLEKYVEDEISELERDMPDFAISSSRLRRIGDRISAYEIIYTGFFSGEKKKVMTIWIIEEGKVYQITYLSHPEIFQLYLKVVNLMIDSFVFR